MLSGLEATAREQLQQQVVQTPVAIVAVSSGAAQLDSIEQVICADGVDRHSSQAQCSHGPTSKVSMVAVNSTVSEEAEVALAADWVELQTEQTEPTAQASVQQSSDQPELQRVQSEQTELSDNAAASQVQEPAGPLALLASSASPLQPVQTEQVSNDSAVASQVQAPEGANTLPADFATPVQLGATSPVASAAQSLPAPPGVIKPSADQLKTQLPSFAAVYDDSEAEGACPMLMPMDPATQPKAHFSPLMAR